MSVLITGSKGFIGNHLTKYLTSKGFPYIELKSDITKFDDLYHELKEYEFASVIHLAGISHVIDCENDLGKAFLVNTYGTQNLLEALFKSKKNVRFLFASTAHIYDTLNINNSSWVFTESSASLPRSAYARSKFSSENLIEQYFNKYQLGQALSLRIFNHIHSSQTGDFIFPYVLSEIKKYINNKNKDITIPVGNIDLYRDFSLIQELIETFYELLLVPLDNKYEIINICSGHGRRIRDLLDLVAKRFNLNIDFKLDPTRVRTNEGLSVIGNNQKLCVLINKQKSQLSDEDFIEKFFEDI